MASLVERVGGTGVTTYVMDAIGFDNKVFFDTKRGVSWTDFDFAGQSERWDKTHGAAARLMQRLEAEGRPALDIVIASCRKIGVEALAGARMNDCFGIAPLLPATPGRSRLLLEHPELAIRLWVRLGARREAATFAPGIGDLVIMTKR